MKKKLLSLLLVVAILATTVSMGFGSVVSVASSTGGKGAEGINAFSLTAGDIRLNTGTLSGDGNISTTGDTSGTATVTIKSNVSGYKIKVNSITAYTIYYNSSDTKVVESTTAKVSYTAGTVCDTSGTSFTVTSTNSNPDNSGIIRYECGYDLLDSSGNTLYSGLTGIGYGTIFKSRGTWTSTTNENDIWGEERGQPADHDDYWFRYFDDLRAYYVQPSSITLKYTTHTDWTSGGTGSTSFSVYVSSGTAPSTLKTTSVSFPGVGSGTWDGNDNTDYTWLAMTTPSSGHYSFTIHSDGVNGSNDWSTEIFYRADGDKTTATNTASTYLNKNLEKSYYTTDSWNNYIAALDNAMLTAKCVAGYNGAYKKACQNAASVSSLSTALSSAESSLVLEGADYTAFNAAEAAFDAKKVLTTKVYTYVAGAVTWGETTTLLYDSTAIANLQSYIDGVNRSYYKYDQNTLDACTKEITEGTANLAYAAAEYKYFDIAEAEFNTYDGKGYIYTEETWNNFTTMCGIAFADDRKGLTADSQSNVNLSINQFIDAREYLEKRPADTTALVAALDEGDVIIAQEVEGTLITTADGYQEAWDAFIEAYNAAAALREVKIDEQDAVDEAATNLAAAVNRLAGYRPLDTTLLVAAIRNRPPYSSDKYVSESYTVWQNLAREGNTFYSKTLSSYTASDKKTHKDYDEMIRLVNMINEAYNGLELVKADFTNLNAAVAKIPSDDELNLYQDDYVNAIRVLYSMIDYGATFEEQTEVDELAASIEYAVAELTDEHLKAADYSEVEAAIAEFESINQTIRTEESLAAVQAAIDAVDYTKNIKQQDKVDAYADAIYEAIANLKYIDADYSKVEEAIAAAEAVENKDDYGNYDRVQAAIDAVDWTLTIDKQADVDAYAEAINAAVENLTLAEADYSGVRAAIAEAEDLEPLSDFTDESVAALDLAISKVVAGYKKNEQAKVDAMEAEIREALDNMELLPANYAEAEAAIAYAKKFNADDYSNYADVQAAIDDVDWELNCRQYDILNAQIQAIYTAVGNLKLLPADYTALNTKIADARYAYANGPYEYTEESIQAVENVISSINWDYDIQHQANVDAYITLIDNALANLKYVRADYTGYDAMIVEYNSKDQNLYVGLDTVYSNILLIPTDLTIDKQEELDSLVEAINTQLANLEYADANYSLVNSSVERYNAINRDYYNEGDLIPVDTAYRSIVFGLKANEQDRVTEMGQNLSDALDTLATKMKDADLTALNAAVEDAKAKFNEMYATGYEIESTSYAKLRASLAEAEKYSNSKINEQANIDALTAQIIADTANLEFVFQIITTEETAYIIEGKYIYGFEEGTMSEQAAEMIEFVGPAEIQFVETRNGFGTGTVIQFVSTKDGSVLDAYTVIVFGDANGDSVIDMFDVAYMCELISTFETPGDAVLKALDLCIDGAIDANDLTGLISLANMDATLKQDGTMQTY